MVLILYTILVGVFALGFYLGTITKDKTMEKINIEELLKNCPQGMELDCPLFDGLEFYHIDNDNLNYPVLCRVQCSYGGYNIHAFTKYGCFNSYEYSKCVIFPKGKTSWEGFVPPCQFKDGDVVATTNGRYIGITTGGNSERAIPTYCVIKISGEFEAYFGDKEKWMFSRFASEEEKQKLFQAIKDRGYKWNAETKTLEKLVEPKFKIGDRIRSLISSSYYNIVDIKDDQYVIKPDAPEKFPYHIDFSLETNYELVPKFDINTLKPFDKVLVRGDVGQKWVIDFFGFMDNDKGFPFVCVGHYVNQCIPYEGNEHLLGKTDDCDDYYKIWQ